MKKIYLILVLGILLVGAFGFISLDNSNEVNKGINYNCDNPDVVYLKPSEKSIAGVAANKIKGIAVIPEENYLVANTELLLKCDNIDFSKYLNMEDFE